MKIDGREIAGEILKELEKEIKKLKTHNIIPHLAIILIGDNPASKAYVRQKQLLGEKISIKTSLYRYSNSVSVKELLFHLNDLNHLSSVHGIIVQQPFPSHIDTKEITLAVDPKKDIDGFNPKSEFQPPIAKAVLKILGETYLLQKKMAGLPSEASAKEGPRAFKDWLKTKKIVVIGKGETGGKPIIETLKKIGIKPTTIDSQTQNPKIITKTADIIISAVGKENIVKADMIKREVILISVGLHKGQDGKLHGDYNEEEIKDTASFYTPSPGGVGPINVAMLLRNAVYASEKST